MQKIGVEQNIKNLKIDCYCLLMSLYYYAAGTITCITLWFLMEPLAPLTEG